MSISYAEAAALRKAAQKAARPRAALRPRSTASETVTGGASASALHQKEQPEPVMFSNVARPGAYYERPHLKRDLPSVRVSDYTTTFMYEMLMILVFVS